MDDATPTVTTRDRLLADVAALPQRPGVYRFFDAAGGVLYVGMTSDLANRSLEHRERMLDGFTKRYGIDRLVYFEAHDEADTAARRERPREQSSLP